MVTYATLQGRITPPGTDIGVRGRLVGTPLSTGQALIITADSRITLGPVEARTDGSGNLPSSGASAFRVPLGTVPAPADLLWQVIFYPEDKNLKPWTVAIDHITASGNITALAHIDLTLVDPALATTVAENAAAAAASQAAAATSATEAQGWADAALSSAADAAADVDAAALSETNAASSASSASTSAGTATTKAGEAATSASSAATSAGTATTKAGEASTSATAAQTAKTAAETARTGAEAAAASVPGSWQPNTVYTANSNRVAPDGSMISRNADGTSRATYDPTEQAAWTPVLAKAGTQENSALNLSSVPRWQPLTAYVTGDIRMAPDGSLVERLTNGTSGSTYSGTNWKTATGLVSQINAQVGTVSRFVYHKADATVARPSGVAGVLWIGSVQPNNLAAGDIWVPSAAQAVEPPIPWFASYSAAAIGQADLTSVASWADSSGNARVLAQATGAKQPVLHVAAGGVPAFVRFAGGQALASAAFSPVKAQPGTIVLAIRMTSVTVTTAVKRILDGLDATNEWVVQQRGTGTVATYQAGAATTLNSNTTTGLAVAGAWQILTVIVNGASSKIRVNGNNITTGNMGALSLGGITLGAKYDQLGSFLDGDLHALRLANSVLTDAQIAATEQAFADACGVSLTA